MHSTEATVVHIISESLCTGSLLWYLHRDIIKDVVSTTVYNKSNEDKSFKMLQEDSWHILWHPGTFWNY
jgi:hypothetical protein